MHPGTLSYTTGYPKKVTDEFQIGRGTRQGNVNLLTFYSLHSSILSWKKITINYEVNENGTSFNWTFIIMQTRVVLLIVSATVVVGNSLSELRRKWSPECKRREDRKRGKRTKKLRLVNKLKSINFSRDNRFKYLRSLVMEASANSFEINVKVAAGNTNYCTCLLYTSRCV